ncbi:MAG: sugar transferase [Flavobacteriia bacterium]|nr:sugar transferase [Flavobacteriia bacterium]
MKKLIIEHSGKEVFDFINETIDSESDKTLIISTTNIFNVLNHKNEIDNIVNLSVSNNFRYINKFFEGINSKLSFDGFYIGRAETYTARKERKKINKIPIIRNIYFFTVFIFLRVFPKIWGLKKIYFFVTRGRNRLLSKAEILGRLVSCGFEIVEVKNLSGYLYFKAKKIKTPDFNMNPSYGPIFKMNRLGKNGKIIGVYKFRTMHPYAEYLQDYVLKLNGYADTGKPANDFRLTPWGRFIRRYWLDEIPQLLNVLKFELKLVGVRPISERYFQDIPSDLQKLRLKHKPGCIPPYVSLDRANGVTDVLKAEAEYLVEKSEKPYTTDIKYFFCAIYNILFKRKRSA